MPTGTVKWFDTMRLLPSIGILFALTACEQAASFDVLGPDQKDQVIYAMTECVSPHPDGKQCNKKTCKKDAESDCMDFATKCFDNDHHWEGTKDAGTCSRVL